MINRTCLATVISAVSLLASGAALAADDGFYIGLGIGYARPDFDTGGLKAAAGAAVTAVSSDSSSFGFTEYGGYRFNQNFAVQASFTDLGKYDFTATRPAATPATGKVTINGFGLAAVGTIPLANDFSVFGKVGAFFSTLNASTSINLFGAGTTTGNKERKVVPNIGIGLDYNITNNIVLRGEVERFQGMGTNSRTIRTDLNLFSAGVYYKF